MGVGATGCYIMLVWDLAIVGDMAESEQELKPLDEEARG